MAGSLLEYTSVILGKIYCRLAAHLAEFVGGFLFSIPESLSSWTLKASLRKVSGLLNNILENA